MEVQDPIPTTEETKLPQKVHSKIPLILIIVGVVVSMIGIYLIAVNSNKDNDDNANFQNNESQTVSNIVAIPEKVLNNKFGFLSGGEEENPFVSNTGGAWVRPHPGPFLWDDMQTGKNEEISFVKTDKIVKAQQNQAYGTLVTIWPFAEWDQLNNLDADRCQVNSEDEFLPQNDQKGHSDYLPLHRCNPHNWESYETWIAAVVERYDGDGNDDMPGLTIPIKYWEIMNEPDLSYQNADPFLVFYKEGPEEYATLLINTARVIRETDSEAQILIAGAAGGDERFLNFYRLVFTNTAALQSFDIGNVHCISNDRETHDFNVGEYKKMLLSFSLDNPIWVTEAEAFYGQNAEENYEFTKRSTEGAIAAQAEKIFYTRYDFDDFRKK